MCWSDAILWCLGSEAFRQELLAQVDELANPHHAGPEIRESDLAKAERLLGEELGRWHWAVDDLRVRRKGDPRKLQIAERLRHETTMTLAWIAERLSMGAPTHLACLLYRQQHQNETSENTLF